MVIGLPPRTMRDVWREGVRPRRRVRPRRQEAPPFKPLEKGLPGIGPGISIGLGRPAVARPAITPYKPKVYRRPREWAYVTKPFFAKIKEPLVMCSRMPKRFRS